LSFVGIDEGPFYQLFATYVLALLRLPPSSASAPVIEVFGVFNHQAARYFLFLV
jgi:hypothetical protein